MFKKILILFLVLIIANCFSLGKVGYLVPAENDTAELNGEELAKSCNIFLFNAVGKANNSLVKTDLNNVGLRLTFGSNCLTITEISKEKK